MKLQTNEKRNKRKGLLLALFIHTAVIGIGIYPFLLASSPDTIEAETVVEFDFRHSAAAANADKKVRNKVILPKTTTKAAPKNEAPPALPTKPTPPVITEPTPMPPLPDLPEVVKPEPTPMPEIPSSPAPVVVDVPAPGPVASTSDDTGTSNSDGAEEGSPEAGDSGSVADEGDGLSPIGSALNGTGILSRAVVFRPKLDEVVRQNGTVALNVCINQRGRVIGVKWNEEKSTIDDKAVVQDAIDKAKIYKFERDYKAPKRECGILSIHIRGL